MDLEYVGLVLARLKPLIRDGELRRTRLERVLAAGAVPADAVRADVERMLSKVDVTVLEDAEAKSDQSQVPDVPAENVNTALDTPPPVARQSAHGSSGAFESADDGVEHSDPADIEPPAPPQSAEALVAGRMDHRAEAVSAARRLLSTDATVLDRRRQKQILTAELEVGLALLMRGGTRAVPCDVVFGELAGEARSAAEALFLHNQRLVYKIANKYPATGMEYEDLAQFGFRGLIRAVEKFDPTAGFKFSTYATWWIRQAITRGIADHSRLIRFPVHMVERLQKVWRVRDRMTIGGEVPPIHSLALATGYSDDQVREALRLGRFDPLSLDMPVGPEGEATLGDLLDLGDDRLDPANEIEFQLMQQQLHAVLDTLSEREAGVISMRFGLTDGNEMTLDQIGSVYGVSRERIRQIQKTTMEQLQDPSRSQVLRDYLGGYDPRQTALAADDCEFAARQDVAFSCPRGDWFEITLSAEAEVPRAWTCPRCGREAEFTLEARPVITAEPAFVVTTDARKAAKALCDVRLGPDGKPVHADAPDELFEVDVKAYSDGREVNAKRSKKKKKK